MILMESKSVRQKKVIGFEVCCLQCFVWQLQYLCDYNIWFNLIFNERIEILRWQKGLRHVRRRDDRILIPRKRMIFGDMEEDRGRDDASLSQPLSDQPRAREIGTLYREAWRENWFYLERNMLLDLDISSKTEDDHGRNNVAIVT